MERQLETFYKAVLARDPRFDGKFFVGVKTTGIYCRPVCPAKPKKENVEFFGSALLAEKAGYRPCLRCRPESAPLSPAWVGKNAVVQRALRLLSNPEMNQKKEEAFANQLGVSARHLRRLFEDELGQTPKQILDQNRLNFARKLVVETKLPMTEIAFAAGFSSLRRFNDAMKKRFKRSPSHIRSLSKAENEGEGIQLRISYRPPFDWESLLQFYRSHAIRPIERVDEYSYTRNFRLEKNSGWLKVEPSKDGSQLLLTVQIEEACDLFWVVQRVRQMFDLDCDPLFLSNAFSSCPVLGKLYGKYPGLRLPRGFDAFETAISSILGQLVSTQQAGNLIEQLVLNYGEKLPLGFVFPSPRVLATASLEKVRTTENRRNAIREFSKLVRDRKILLDSTQDPENFRKQLLAIKGIGPWTAHYISLRAIGDTDAFPETDLILRRVIQQEKKLSLEAVKPWRAYAAIYLWKEFAQELSKKGKRQ